MSACGPVFASAPPGTQQHWYHFTASTQTACTSLGHQHFLLGCASMAQQQTSLGWTCSCNKIPAQNRQTTTLYKAPGLSQRCWIAVQHVWRGPASSTRPQLPAALRAWRHPVLARVASLQGLQELSLQGDGISNMSALPLNPDSAHSQAQRLSVLACPIPS
jgi:hypothetical protein